MKIIDLNDKLEPLYHVCLEDWSEEMKEAGTHKETWCSKMKDKGLRVKLVLDDEGVAAGMIEYIPIEHSFAEGEDLYYINCIWVHGHKKGRGNYQKKGMGKALLKAAEEDAKAHGAKGMVAFGVTMPFWMPAAWFKKRGYTPVDKDGMRILLWKPFCDNVATPRWIKKKKELEKSSTPGKVTITAFIHGYCPAQNAMYERVKRAAEVFKDKVELITIDTLDRDIFLEWGISNAIYIEGKNISDGPPKSYEKICKLIEGSIKRQSFRFKYHNYKYILSKTMNMLRKRFLS